jgi:hypothetical protein
VKNEKIGRTPFSAQPVMSSIENIMIKESQRKRKNAGYAWTYRTPTFRVKENQVNKTKKEKRGRKTHRIIHTVLVIT